MQSTISFDHPIIDGEKYMELDQEDKALAITARPKELQYSTYVLHEHAQRVHRVDFVE